MALLILAACSSSEAQKKSRMDSLAPAPKQALERAKPRVSPLLSSSAGASLSLQLAQSQTPAGLSRYQQQALELSLQLPEGDSWNSARIGRAVIRQPDGSQLNLLAAEKIEALRDVQSEQALAIPALLPGTSMLIVSAGSSDGQRGQDNMANNHRFSKIIVQQADTHGRIPPDHGDIMQKTGQPLEIRPLRIPSALRAGDEMSIKVYEDQSHRAQATVEVHHPDGEVQLIKTGSNGVAHFDVRVAGMHHLRYNTTLGEREASAELSFSTRIQGAKQ